MYFDTADVDAREREAFVGDILCNGVVPLEIEHLGRAGQGVELQLFSAELGPLNLQSLRSSATAFKRTARLVRDGSPPTVVLAVHRAGLICTSLPSRSAAPVQGPAMSMTSDLGISSADPRTLLPQGAYLGSRPPVLPDMLDDTVSTSVQIPAVQTMIVISGMQFPLAG